MTDELAALRWHWGEAYIIERRGTTWKAVYRDGNPAAILTTNSAWGLRELIWKDYFKRREVDCSRRGE